MAISEDIQKLYIAYFGRPADPAGLAFYLAKVNQRFDGDTRPILAEFFDSTEYKTLYNFDITKAEGRQAAVNQVYQNLLNRQADAEGLAFYSNKLEQNPSSGLSLLVLDVLGGVRNLDVDTIENKLLAASVFTQRLDTQAERDSYNGNRAVLVAREYLSGIDANTLFQPQENGNTLDTRADQFIGRLVGSSNLTFTNIKDNLLGTVANESAVASLRFVNGTLDATNSTLNDGDVIDMAGNTGGGIDELKFNITGNRLSSASTLNLGISGVERLTVDNQESDAVRNVVFNLNDTDGALNSVRLNATRLGTGFDSITTVSGLKQLVDVTFFIEGVAGGALNSTPELNAQINSSNRELALKFDAAAVATSADALTVRIDGTNIVNVLSTPNQNLTPQLTNFKLSGAGVESLFVINANNAAESAKVPGPSQALIRSLVLGSDSDTSRITVVQSDSDVFRVDASALGSKLKEFDGTRVASTNTLVLDVGSSLNASQLLRGGSSVNDVLVLSSPASLNQTTLDSISQFETIRLDSNSTETLNVKGVRGLRSVELRGSVAGDQFTVSNIQFDSNGTLAPEVFITRENSRINALTANLSTETTGNVGQMLNVGVASDMAKLTVANPRALTLTTELPVVKDFVEAVAVRRVIDNLQLQGVTSLVLDATLQAGGTLELGGITTDVLRTVSVANGGVGTTVLTMNGMVNKSTNVALDITGGAGSDRIFGSNQSDNIQGGGGVDLINLMDGTTPQRDRVIFEDVLSSFGDTILNFRPVVSAANATDNDVLVFDRKLAFANPSTSDTRAFGPETVTTPGLLGLGSTTTVTPDTRIHILGTTGTNDVNVDANDVIVIMSNAIRNQLGITAADLEAGGLTRLTDAVNSITNATSSERFILFVSNDVDTFGFQFSRVVTNNTSTDVDETAFANRVAGSTPLVKLIGLNTASPLDQTDFELIG
ncbi:MAG: hypothetical protein QE278_10325 [Limnobacter sp.]|nr:hypothetical protein [Limnobacter sp.]